MSGRMNWKKDSDYRVRDRLHLEEERIDRSISIDEKLSKMKVKFHDRRLDDPKPKKSMVGQYKHIYVLQSYLQSDCTSTEQFEKKFRNEFKRLLKKSKEFEKPVFTKFSKGTYIGETYQSIYKSDYNYFMWYFWSVVDKRMYMMQNVDLSSDIGYFFDKVSQ